MRKFFLITRSNIRKAKGQTVAIVVLILIAALMLNLWLMLSTDYRANFDRYHDKLNAEHVTISIDDTDGVVGEFLSQTLENDSKVSEYSLDSYMHMICTFPYNGSEMSSWIVFMNKDSALTRRIGKVEIVKSGDFTDGIYLPLIYETDDVKIGKPVKISIGSYTVEYTVCGFFNSVMAGSHNCGMFEVLLSEEKYSELEALGYAPKSMLCSIRLKDYNDNLNYEAYIKSAISENIPGTSMISNSYDMVAQARYISQGICSGVLSTMAFLVLFIALVVIASNIINHVQVNMKNLGTLKAIGYTSRQLILSVLLQFMGLVLLASVIGAALSYGVFPAINGMMIAQTGIPYAVRFLPLPILLSILILCGAVALAAWLSSRRIKKIAPITALRSGVQTHNFKRNFVPLEKTKTPLNFALALKTTLSGVKHNITVCITMLVLSLVVVFSGLMTENIIGDTGPFVNLIIGETADSCINVNAEAEEEFLSEMKADVRVKKAYLYNSINVTHFGGAELIMTITDDFSDVNNPDVIYKGRFPKYSNEIAIGAKYANETGFEIGSEIKITANGKTEKYIITGFTQVSNYLGRDGLLTRQGYERLGELKNASYYLNIADGVDIDGFNAEMKEKFSGSINTAMNIAAIVDSAAAVYVSLVKIIVIAILVLAAVIIAFVLYLLVRTMLNNKKRDYGILKSLGFTTGQLILQTALSFMPAILISAVIGLTVGCVVINPLMSLFLSGLGIMKCTFNIPVSFTTFVGIGLVLLSFGLACLLSLKIKKITPRALIVGE